MNLKNVMIIAFLLVGTFFVSNAQSADSRWVFGAHLAMVRYQNDDDAKFIGSNQITQIPRLSVAMYFKHGFTLEGALGVSTFDSLNYTTIDGTIRYDFGNTVDKVVPYVLVGGSGIIAFGRSITLNLGAGTTVWFLPNYGFNFQLMYKILPSFFESQFTHFYPSAGIVYSFKSRNMNPRLWDKQH